MGTVDLLLPNRTEPKFNGEDAFKQLEKIRKQYVIDCRIAGVLEKNHPDWDWSSFHADCLPLSNQLNTVQRVLRSITDKDEHRYYHIREQLKINKYL